MIKNKIVNIKDPVKPKTKFSRILLTFFLSVYFCMGLDFGFSKILKKNVQVFANYHCSFISIVIIIAILIQMVHKFLHAQVTTTGWFTYGLIQYSLHVIFLRFSKYNLYNLILDVNSVNIGGNKKYQERLVSVIIIFFNMTYVAKNVLCFYFCATKTNDCDSIYIPGYLYCAVLMGVDVMTLVQILIYYYIYTAAKDLVVFFKDREIKWIRKQFTAVADICDKINPTYGRLVSTFVSHVV